MKAGRRMLSQEKKYLQCPKGEWNWKRRRRWKGLKMVDDITRQDRKELRNAFGIVATEESSGTRDLPNDRLAYDDTQ